MMGAGLTANSLKQDCSRASPLPQFSVPQSPGPCPQSPSPLSLPTRKFTFRQVFIHFAEDSRHYTPLKCVVPALPARQRLAQ